MATSPSAAQDVEGTPQHPPIIFQGRREKPDVCLTVFHQEFHVHSAVLKFYSEFFATFLDSPEKTQRVNGALTGFRYTWVTEVDEGGRGGHLVAAEATKLTSYAIYDFREFHVLIELADYYRPLPMVSRSRDGAMTDDEFLTVIWCAPSKVLGLATKLRHSLLFRECFVIIASRWNTFDAAGSHFGKLSDPELRKVVLNAHRQMAEKVARAQQFISEQACIAWQKGSADSESELRLEKIKEASKQAWDSKAHKLRLPRYFRLLRESSVFNNLADEDPIDDVLANNLVLDRCFGSAAAVSGGACGIDRFFCAEVSDEDLPWDVNETDF